MKNLKTYWTVKTPITTLYYKDYKNAKKEGLLDYRDLPIKHTVKEETYIRLEREGIFED